MSDIITLDGGFLAWEMTGIPRYAKMIIIELDKIVKNNSVEIIIPNGYENRIDLINIKKIILPNKSHWLIRTVPKYIRKNRRKYINLTNGVSFCKKSCVCIHDIRPLIKIEGEYFDSFKFRIYTRIIFLINSIFAKKIVTVSDFSKKVIVDNTNVREERISVISPGWQHIQDMDIDYSIINKYKIPNDFILLIGSKSPHKNIEWAIKNAIHNKDMTYVIVGGGNLDYSILPSNVLDLPYLSDEMIKGLYKKCTALLLPSFFEGFGLTPLEAMSCGAKAIISNRASLPEIYCNSAYYIDPKNPNININELLSNKVSPSNEVLDKYSWEKSAADWKKIIDTL